MSDDIKTEELDNETAIYELGYHIVSSVGEEQLPKEVSKVKEVIEKHGGTFIMEEFPTLLRLAYTLVRPVEGKREKHDTVFFGWVKFELSQGTIVKVKEELDLNDRILRFLITRTVREDTRAPKRATMPHSGPKEKEKVETAVKTPVKKEAPAEQISEEELDRTIDELVVE